MVSFKGKKVLLVGIARSGISTLQALKKLDAVVTINDIKSEDSFGSLIEELSKERLFHEKILGRHPGEVEIFDYIVLSPGVPTDLPFIESYRKKGINIIGELELSYLINPKCFYIGITGTNGKTTTTSLTGEIFKKARKDTRIVGNIGLPVISQVFDSNEDTYMITEISSFQLESIDRFKVSISAVLNITPDHLNRHKTMERYIEAKERIFKNQTQNDYAIFNFDDPVTRAMATKTDAKVSFFSRLDRVPKGVYIKDNGIWLARGNGDGVDEFIIGLDDIFIPGNHNVENAMASIIIALTAGIDKEVIIAAIKDFRGVEHRIEFVGEIDGVKYYNDSKATNTDASIKAIEAMKGDTVLIAGGMDKASEFDDFIMSFGEKVKYMILLGETKDKMKKTAISHGFEGVFTVETMEEAVKKAKEMSKGCSNVLLSPACASWDMYDNFEARGNHFKKIFEQISKL